MLSNAAVKAARVRASAYKLWDGDGLHLHVATTGTKAWRFRMRSGKRETTVTLGQWPELDLAAARDRRDDVRLQLRRGEDPSPARRRAEALAPATFEPVARAWAALQAPTWSPVHHHDVITSLERDVFPAIGAAPIGAIDAPAIVALLRAIEGRGALETAKRVRQRISGIFQYAIAEGICSADPAAVTKRALKKIGVRGRQPALTEIGEAQQLLAAVDQLGADPIATLASRFLALTAVRLAVVRGMRWSEVRGIDWAEDRVSCPIWHIPAARMKLSVERKASAEFDHLVPLPRQTVEILRAVRAIAGAGAYVFPGARDRRRPLAENAIGALYSAAGYAGRHSPHGWRATFSTIMKKRARRAGRNEDIEPIELMLAHMPKDKVEAAYDRDAQIERRAELHQEWADALMALN